ncbi:uncharacterized protein LOC101847325 [Aplysia californica]|uniref:Uncharacterized protein LOC101847325 n=1 Tax=Aplysia californica TaxID=6500 RepID=A0ABM1VQR5_APLCA|nr:uncharacterized protein LOC101847325 [Aplysia californica]
MDRQLLLACLTTLLLGLNHAQNTRDADVTVEANNARRDHIGLISVGVGPNVNTGELQAIADDPDKDHMFNPQDYSALAGLSKKIIDAACTVQTTAPSRTTAQPDLSFDIIEHLSSGAVLLECLPEFCIVYPVKSLLLVYKDDVGFFVVFHCFLSYLSCYISALNDLYSVATLLISQTTKAHTKEGITFNFFSCQSFPPACTGYADVVFVVDSSDGVGQADYQKELDLVKNTVNKMNIGDRGMHVGMVTYGTSSKTVFNLKDNPTAAALNNAIGNAPFVGGTEGMLGALQTAKNQMFTPAAGVRDKTSRIVVLVSGGRSNNAALTKLRVSTEYLVLRTLFEVTAPLFIALYFIENYAICFIDSIRKCQEYYFQADELRANDIDVYSVGIGAGVDINEMNGIASDPDTRYVYTADNFDSAQALADVLGPKICNEIPEDPKFLPPPTGCLQKADVMFLLDSSSSIGQNNFQKLEDFLKNTVKDLDIGPDKVRVGMMQYSSYPSLEFPLNMHGSRYDVLKAIDQVKYMGGGANTADALRYMRQLGFSQNSGARADVPRVAVVITDGSSPNRFVPSADVTVEANNARRDHIGLISVGVGPNVNTGELQAIADDPDKDHMFNPQDYSALAGLSKKIIDAACTEASKPLLHQGPQLSLLSIYRSVYLSIPSSSSGGTLPPDPCKDKISTCANYGSDLCTGTYKTWAKVNCERYCGICSPLYTVAPPTCNDVINDCVSYGIASCSGSYRPYMEKNCKRFCGYCGIDTQSLGFCNTTQTNVADGSCAYKGQTYSTGEKWSDGCDYECVCEDGKTGKYRCYNKCPIYHNLPADCTLVKDPSSCCLQPQCNFDQTVGTTQGANKGSRNGIGKSPKPDILLFRFYQKLHDTSSRISSEDWGYTCVYGGKNYYQDQQWQDGCNAQCVCVDAKTGRHECHDLCPTYTRLPSYCRLEKKTGACCPTPVCEFQNQQGTFTGLGTISSNGIGQTPATLPPCVNKLNNCPLYGKPACTQYAQWAFDNCRDFCGLCGTGPAPGPNDKCLYQGSQYSQGQSWFVGSDKQCTCENAVSGYYRCTTLLVKCSLRPTQRSVLKMKPQLSRRCPTYTNLPPTCTVKTVPGQACDVITCPSGTFISSSNNLATLGNGGNIQKDPASGYVPPTLPSGAAVPPGTGGSPDNAPKLSELGLQLLYFNPHLFALKSTDGCLYNGQLYVKGQRWNDGCSKSCECLDGATGRTKCRQRCPDYAQVPAGCTMISDPDDTCCHKPKCSDPNVVPVPHFKPYTTTNTPVAPPPNNDRFVGTGDLFGPHGGKYTVVQTGTPIPTPGVGVFSTGGIGHCEYKGKQYLQGEIWEDGCDYNCVCDDASFGHYTCTQKCVIYTNIPFPYCRLIEDPGNKCCKIPSCVWTAPYERITDYLVVNPTTPAMVASSLPPTPAFAFCVYKGKSYDQNQVWYDGCDFKCTCEEPSTNKYRCETRCPDFPNVAPNCKFVADTKDPSCCTVPECPTPSPLPGVSPDPTPTGVPGVITGGVDPPGTSSGNNKGFCEYQGKQYKQDEKWDNGCEFSCVCEDAVTGKYKCTEKCKRYTNLAPGCYLVDDFANPCCQIPRCDASPNTQPTISPNQNPGSTRTPGNKGKDRLFGLYQWGSLSLSLSLVSPAFCVYNGVQYTWGQQWVDGCDKKCQCDNADTGSYSCTERSVLWYQCFTYDNLPPECKLVTDPKDSCCLVPECGTPAPVATPAPPTLPGGSVAPGTQGPNPTPVGTPVPTPTAVVGKITGVPVTVPPTPGPDGKTVAPPTLTYCEYKGTRYNQGQKWNDGCQFQCECVNALVGKYECTEKCPRYVNLSPLCRLVRDPSNPCCEVPDCQPNPNSPGPTLAPGSTRVPTTASGPTPPPKDVCVYKSQTYTQGQKWFDGCDYSCECENANQGLYRCDNRCPSYDAVPKGCHFEDDPSDPLCCKVIRCDIPTSLNNQTGTGLIPTPPPAIKEGGYATPAPTPTDPNAPPPLPGQPTPSPVPPGVCVYKGRQYQQGRRWQDGCDYNCECLDGTGRYKCTEIQGVCVYNGVPFTQGQKWNDGCDLQCICENATTGFYRCNQRCPKYTGLPKSCSLIPDPNDPTCCEIPQCLPTPGPNQPVTPGPTQTFPTLPTGSVTGNAPVPPPTTSQPGQTTVKPPQGCMYKNTRYAQGQQWQDGCQYNCVCDDGITGKYTCTQRRDKLLYGFCEYKGQQYQTGNKWIDGCDFNCECLDQIAGVYSCSQRCSPYPNIPSYCILVQDPKDQCCEVPYCPGAATLSPNPNQSITPPINPSLTTKPTATPYPTLFPALATTLKPPPGGVPTKDVCVYMGKSYTQGQRWDVGCDKVCVCEDGKTGGYSCTDRKAPPPACVYKGSRYQKGQTWQDGCQFECVCLDDMSGQYKCTDKCPRYPNLPVICQLVYDPQNPCCKKAECPTPGPDGLIPTPAGTPVPDVCVYNGVPYRQGQIWKVGCDKICVCEDAKARTINCDDRCPTFQAVPAGCQLTTDPQDNCCQVLDCPVPPAGQPITPLPPKFVTGKNVPAQNPTPFTGGTSDVCIYQGKVYKQSEKWQDGCTFTCVCTDSTQGKYMCTDRCPTYPKLPPQCTMVQDPNDPCCKKPFCARTPAPPPGSTPPPGQPTSPGTPTNGPTPIAKPPDMCEYNGRLYKQSQQWYDGCNKVCKCENANMNFYRCEDRCAVYSKIPSGCSLVPDPKDPTCCEVPDCPVQIGASPTAGFVPTPANPTPGSVTGIGKIPTPGNTPKPSPGQPTPPALPKNGCFYNNTVYKQGDKWTVGCKLSCVCSDGVTGKYECNELCPPVPSNLPPVCRALQDPQNPCCPRVYCDSLNPTPVFPTPPVNPSDDPQVYTPGPTTSFTGQSGYCVYQGVYYRQGQTWQDGCSKVCKCENVTTGYYSCKERCPTFDNLPPQCKLIANPNDPCCVVPDCNTFPTPAPTGPNGQTLSPPSGPTPPPVFTPTPAPPGIITGTGNGPAGMCVYNGKSYGQYQAWNDGCDYKCECIDAQRGQFKCTDRCNKYYGPIPQQCYKVPDPSDSCCQDLKCDMKVTLTPRPQNVPSTTALVIVQDKCVYTNGKQYGQGSIWSDGCAGTCRCIDATVNNYACNSRCPVYSSLPKECTLTPDPNDQCCMQPTCTGNFKPIIGGSGPTMSPTLDPSQTNVFPIGTHTTLTGSELPPPPGPGNTITGQRVGCVYSGVVHRQGDRWNDGCDYVCSCVDESQGIYRCTSKCPQLPPMPSYCSKVTIPGQCCEAVSCNLPGKGYYSPVPELTPDLIPTPGPVPTPGQTTPMTYVVGIPPGSTTGTSLPGNGSPVPSGTDVTGLRADDSCKDVAPNCPDYGINACSGVYKPWAEKNCQAYCKLCPTKPKDQCFDLLDSCSNMGPLYCSGVYQTWAQKNCNKTCNLCNPIIINVQTNGFSGNTTGDNQVSGGNNTIGRYSQYGWATLLKGVTNAPGDLWGLWTSKNTSNEKNPVAMELSNRLKEHYKPDLSNYWNDCKFDMIKLSLMTNGKEDGYIIFDSKGTDKLSWFDSSRIINSTFSDLSSSSNFDAFTSSGDPNTGRHFVITQSTRSCDIKGWLIMSTRQDCFFERGVQPGFHYSANGKVGQFGKDTLRSDIMVISGYGGKCFNGTIGQHKRVCPYGGKEYNTGDEWQDGCEKKCKCIDANFGYYKCDPLCPPINNLPPGARIVKKNGTCCGEIVQDNTAGCYYQGNFYAQNEKWEDACDYNCECVDASQGFYQCSAKCFTFQNLPSMCKLLSPPPGKCCPTVSCPPGIVINYPDGYVQQ